MPKSGDKVIIKGKRHSVARKVIPLIDDLKSNPWVKRVGAGRMHARSGKQKDLALRIQWFNEHNSTYKIVADTKDYEQELLVTVDPGRRIFLKRYISLYCR